MAKISSRDLVHDIIPKLKATENMVRNTLKDAIANAASDQERDRQLHLQQEFELEITMIRMNLDHFLKRYAEEIRQSLASDDNTPGRLLQMDSHEQVAIERARKLYARARSIQAGL